MFFAFYGESKLSCFHLVRIYIVIMIMAEEKNVCGDMCFCNVIRYDNDYDTELKKSDKKYFVGLYYV